MPSILHVLFSSIAAGIGIVFNGYILFVFVWNRRIQTANRLLLLHLAFVDTVFCLVILLYNTSLSASLSSPSLAIAYVIGPKNLRPQVLEAASQSRWCRGHGFLWTILPLVLVWNVCGLSCDRYAAISSPLHYSRLVNTRRATYFVIAIWCVGVAFASAPLMGICPYTFWDARWACTSNCLSTKATDLVYAIAYAVVAVVLPVIIILLCNLHMLLISKYHRHSFATAIYEVTLKAQATITHQKNPSYLSKFKGKNAFITIGQVIGSLTLFVVPYHVVLVWEAANGQTCDEVFVSLTTILLTCSPSINAYVYGVKSRMLRQTVKRLLEQHVVKRENNNKDIKRRLSEIFSEDSKTPISRRMSAPPEYGRKTPTASCQPCLLKDVNNEGQPQKIKTPFLRSISLPTTASTAYSHDPTEEATKLTHKESTNSLKAVTSRRGHHHYPLSRGESAPEEEIVSGELTVIDQDAFDGQTSSQATTLTRSRGDRKMSFTRSSSYPLAQQPSFQTSKRKRLLAMKAQHAIELDEDIEVNELSPSCDQTISSNACWSQKSSHTRLGFQVSQV